jgi:hypothetical protein
MVRRKIVEVVIVEVMTVKGWTVEVVTVKQSAQPTPWDS